MRMFPSALVTLACLAQVTFGKTLVIIVDKTLSGTSLTWTPANITLNSQTDYMNVDFNAPYNSSGNNSVHIFLANANKRITELRITETGLMTTLLYWAPHNILKQFESQANVSVADNQNSWSGSARVNKDYLPSRISLYNAAVRHQVDGETQYDALYTITNYGVALPDLMVLDRYISIESNYLNGNDEKYSKAWKRT